jgi:glutaredoxin
MAVTLYVKNDSPPCDRLREKLERGGVRFHEINVDRNPERVPELLKLTGGRRVVPVLVDGVEIGVAPDGGTEF